MYAMSANTLEDAIQNITEGCAGCRMPSQNWMYYIYKLYDKNVPIVGTQFDIYKRVKAIAGSSVMNPHNECHEYALMHRSHMGWFFTDDIFGDN